jgi:hypothetical protein
VVRKEKRPQDQWKPEVVIERSTSISPFHFYANGIEPFRADNGTTESFDISSKWSDTILADILDRAGGNSWERWKADRAAKGLPVLDNYGRVEDPKLTVAAPVRVRKPKPQPAIKVDQEAMTAEVAEAIARAKSGGGAAAILPA